MLKGGDPRNNYDVLGAAIRNRLNHNQYGIKRILIVDDSKDFAHGIKEFLHKHTGIHTESTIRTNRAIAVLRMAVEHGRPFQVVISDMQMGLKNDDGLTFLGKVKRQYPEIRTILMSSTVDTTFQPCESADFRLHKDTHDMLTHLLLLIDRLAARVERVNHQPMVEGPIEELRHHA